MGLLDRARAAIHAFTQSNQTEKGVQTAWSLAFSTGFDNWLMNFGGGLTKPFAQHPTIYAAVSAISQGISALPIEMFPDSDEKREKPLKKSMVGELLTNPGLDMDGQQFMEGTIDFMELDGEAFWFMDGLARRGPGGPQFPTTLELWEPKQVKAVVKDERVTAWQYQNGADVFTTTPDRVIQFKHFNPYDPIRGLAPLSAAMLPAQGGYKALSYQDAFFENSAVMGGLITPKEGAIIQPEAMRRLLDELEARHQGSQKRGRLGGITAPVDYKELGMSQKEMDFPGWLDASSAYILMVFKVPPSVAGMQKDANYNASVQQAKQFWFNHLPLAHYIERRIKQRLCKAFGIAETPYFKTESIKAMTEDQESLTNQARNLWNMGISFKDINDRLELGFPADDIAADTRWVTFSLVNADEQAMAPASDATGGPSRGPAEGDTPAQPGDESTNADDPTQGKMHLVGGKKRSEFHRRMNWKTLISRVREEESAYDNSVKTHFYLMRNEMLAKLRTFKAIKLPPGISIDLVMYDDEKAAADIEKRVEPIYKSSLRKGAESIIAELNLEIPFDFLAPETQKFLQEKMFEIADLVDQPVSDRLRATLQEGISAGESVDKLADRVREAFSVERVRALRIARTEVAESFNGGRFATMKEAGVEKLEWLSARDDRVRDSHVDVDGEIVVLGDRFSNGLLYPLDPGGPPEEIVNCRCVSLPVA
jgi:HK97 family phage portal protein